MPKIRPKAWSLAGGYQRKEPVEMVPFEDYTEPGVLEGIAKRCCN